MAHYTTGYYPYSGYGYPYYSNYNLWTGSISPPSITFELKVMRSICPPPPGFEHLATPSSSGSSSLSNSTDSVRSDLSISTDSPTPTSSPETMGKFVAEVKPFIFAPVLEVIDHLKEVNLGPTPFHSVCGHKKKFRENRSTLTESQQKRKPFYKQHKNTIIPRAKPLATKLRL